MHEIADRLANSVCAKVERNQHRHWAFWFGDRMTVNASSPWRILAGDKIALGDCDHAQQFGLPAPLNGIAESERLLANRPVRAVSIRKDTGDLTIAFDGATTLEIFNNSSGYEGWRVVIDGFSYAVAMGGDLVIWKTQ